MTPRTYSNTSVETTLASGITAGAASLVVADATGYPAAPFAIVVDAGGADEEIVLVTAKSGTTFTVTRAYDDTTAKAHSAGASVIHAAIADDFRGKQLGTRDVATTAPTAGQALVWDGSAWAPGAAGVSDHGALTGLSDDHHTQYHTDARGDARYWPLSTDLATQAELNTHEADTTSVHGIADTSTLYRAGGTDVTLADGGTGASLSDPNADRILFWDDSAGAVTFLAAGTNLTITGTTIDASGGGGVSDGDKGDITVSGSGATWTIDNDAVTYAKLQNVSATSRILGRVTSGAGDVEELTGAQALSITGAQAAIPLGRPVVAGVNYYVIPGTAIISLSTGALNNNRIRYFPIFVPTTITIDQLAIEVTTAGAAATVVRLGIYTADTSLQPAALVLDAGTVAADTTGVKAISILQQLTPGRYLLCLNTDGTPSLRLFRGLFQGALLDTIGANSIISQIRVNSAYAAFPASPVAADTVIGASTPFEHMIVCRVSTP